MVVTNRCRIRIAHGLSLSHSVSISLTISTRTIIRLTDRTRVGLCISHRVPMWHACGRSMCFLFVLLLVRLQQCELDSVVGVVVPYI